MTTIDKIALCGIRSYDPSSLVVIKFFKPLTIILGNNGCGKTTIIEALKYVCTGDVPPLSERGRTFVHDPNHCGVNIVKAQVKVAFKTRDNKPIIVNSSMQLTQKRTKIEFKTIDGVIRMYDDTTNEQIALSHKCADMKRVVPELMGVSRAILDNVIFCHQEDANWPLSEAKKLKEKFDEIFATSRWSKALIAINQYRKTLNGKSKDLKIDLKVFENNKEIAHKLTDDLQETKIRMAQYKERISVYCKEIKELKIKIIPLQDSYKKLSSFDGKRQIIENDINHLRKQQKEAHDRMQCEYEENDDELQQFLKNHQQQIINKENELKDANNKYEKLKKELMHKKQRLSQLHSKRGKIEQIIDDYKNKQNHLLKQIKHLTQKYNIKQIIINDNNNNNNYDPLIVNKTLNELQNAEKNKKQEMEQHQRSQYQNDQSLEKDINQYVTKKNKFDFRSQELIKQQRECDTKRYQQNCQINQIKQQLNDCQNIENQITSIKSKVDEYNNNDPTKRWEQEINESHKTIQNNSKRMKLLNEERKSLQSQSSQTAKLQFKNEQYLKINNNYNKSLKSLKPKIVSILNDMPSIDGLDERFIAKNRALKSEYEKCQKQYNSMQTKQTVNESKLSSLQCDKEKLERNVSDGVIKLSQCSLSLDDNMDGLIQKARDSAKNKEAELALAKCGRTLYSKFNNLARKKNQCPVCQRAFNTDHELQSFIKTNSNRIKNVEKSGAIEKHENDANKAQKKLESLQSSLPIYQNAKKQQNELKDLEQQFKKMNLHNKKIGDELEVMFTQHIETKSVYDKSSMLISNVNELCRQYKNLKQQRKEYEIEKNKLAQISMSKRTLNDVQNEYDGMSTENNEKTMSSSRLRKQINEFDKKKRRAHNELIQLQQKSANYDKLNNDSIRIKNDLQKLNEKKDNLAVEIAKIQSEIEPMDKIIRQKREQRQQQRSISQQKERRIQEDLRKFASDINNLQIQIKGLKRSEETVNKYSNIANDVQSEEMQFKELETRYNSIDESKRNIEKWLDNVVIDQQDLQNNLAFRKYQRFTKEKKVELQNLRNEMNSIAPNAENINNEIDEMSTKIAIDQSNLDQNKGGFESEKRKAMELMRQLRSDRYSDIDEKYRHQLIKYETTLIANKDLDKFEKALDKSLIEFHSLKMREINSVLKELWQQTYRGKDIDYIEIVSEIGNQKNTKTTTTKRKNYNYNVVMVQGDTSLAMRGRCSAGQRVLAALLIRLALAETFCLNCGVLALDEPTTNLDSKNIEALAYALNQIITRRKRQENFQLILITHDENFVEKLGQREHTDGYYRVFKNDFQHSKAKLYRFNNQVAINDDNKENNNKNNKKQTRRQRK